MDSVGVHAEGASMLGRPGSTRGAQHRLVEWNQSINIFLLNMIWNSMLKRLCQVWGSEFKGGMRRWRASFPICTIQDFIVIVIPSWVLVIFRSLDHVFHSNYVNSLKWPCHLQMLVQAERCQEASLNYAAVVKLLEVGVDNLVSRIFFFLT